MEIKLSLHPRKIIWNILQPDKFKHISDESLLQAYRTDGNREWLGILLQRYSLMLFGVGMKYMKNEADAKDIVQQVFYKAIIEVSKYKVDYFKSWIYMIAKNQCLMQLRKKGIKTTEIFDHTQALIDEEEESSFIRKREYSLNHLEIAVENLNPEQKQCVTLFYLEKKSYQEIVQITGFTLMQVKSHIQNGKRNLKIILEKHL